MSARGVFKQILTAATPATTSTATTAFKVRGNALKLLVTTTTGGAGTLTINARTSDNGATYYKVLDADSEAAWTSTDINTAGTYEINLSGFATVPGDYVQLYYKCTNAAGTIAIAAVSWENPAGSVDVGDVAVDVGDITVDTEDIRVLLGGTIGTPVTVAFDASAVTSVALSVDSNYLFLATEDCHVKFGAASAVATVAADMPVPAWTPVPITTPSSNTYVAAIKHSVAGTLYMTPRA